MITGEEENILNLGQAVKEADIGGWFAAGVFGGLPLSENAGKGDVELRDRRFGISGGGGGGDLAVLEEAVGGDGDAADDAIAGGDDLGPGG